MNRQPARPSTSLPVLTALAFSSGCPLPQPLVEASASQPVTPPRIVVDDGDPTHLIPYSPIPSSSFRPDARSGRDLQPSSLPARPEHHRDHHDTRWFVNYDPNIQQYSSYSHQDYISADASSASDPTLRQTPIYEFIPSQFDPEPGTGVDGADDSVGALHIVDLVVSNSFDDTAGSTLPYRTPAAGYEVQEYRWVFLGVPQSATVTCPSE